MLLRIYCNWKSR